MTPTKQSWLKRSLAMLLAVRMVMSMGVTNAFAADKMCIRDSVDTKARIIAYDIRELGEQLMPIGMLVTLDAIFNRVIQNWKKGKTTWVLDRKSTRLNSSHSDRSRMPSSA